MGAVGWTWAVGVAVCRMRGDARGQVHRGSWVTHVRRDGRTRSHGSTDAWAQQGTLVFRDLKYNVGIFYEIGQVKRGMGPEVGHILDY